MSLQLFSKNLKYITQKKGLTRKYLSIQLKVSIGTIGKWRDGVCYPDRHELLFRLCDTLEIESIDQFLRTDMSIETKVIKHKRAAKAA